MRYQGETALGFVETAEPSNPRTHEPTKAHGRIQRMVMGGVGGRVLHVFGVRFVRSTFVERKPPEATAADGFAPVACQSVYSLTCLAAAGGETDVAHQWTGKKQEYDRGPNTKALWGWMLLRWFSKLEVSLGKISFYRSPSTLEQPGH
jgi:hypothetical protein